MAIHIQSGKNNLQISEETLKAHVQLMPCKIHCDCSGPVEKYFDRYVKKGDDNVLSVSFRGYPLKGKVIDLPDSYKGIVLHESVQPTTEKEERKFYVVNTFDKITYWNWGKIPSQNDAINQALQWVDIADALHSPITEE